MLPEPNRILLIDDEEIQSVLVAGYLAQISQHRYDVEWAANSSEALSMLQAQRIDACLLDYELGGEDGLRLLREIMKLPNHPPVILLTAKGNLEVDIQAMALGATEYLDKNNLKPDLLERTLRYAIQRHRAYTTMQASQERLQTVLETIPAGVFIYQDKRLRYTNPMLSVMTHFTVDELARMDLFDLVHPDEQTRVQNRLPEQGNYYLPIQPETKFLTAGGQIRWFGLTLAATQYDERPAVLGAVIDITKRIQAEKDLLLSEQRFRALVENSSDLIVQIDQEGTITYISPSIKHILDYAETTWMNQAITHFIKPEHHQKFETALAQCLQEPDARPSVRVEIKNVEETWVWMDVILSNMMHMPSLHVIVLNMRDVTEQQRRLSAEQHQRAMSDALLDTFIALNNTLDLADIINQILKNVGKVVRHDSANIMLIEGDMARMVSQVGLPTHDEWQNLVLPIESFPTLRTMQHSRVPLMIPDIALDERWLSTDRKHLIRSYVGVPIIVNNEVFGFLNLESTQKNFFDDRSVQYLLLFSFQAATALKNAQAYQQAQELAGLEERQRLARDLHDTVSQVLFSANMIADSLGHVVQPDDRLANGIYKLRDLNRGALAEMRSLLVELRPQSIVHTALPTLIENLTNSVSSRSSIQITTELEAVGELPEEVHLAFYRIIQEALNNIIKHAAADHVMIALKQERTQAHLLIEDNGSGFDKDVVAIGHHGLEIMQERAAKIEAKLSITSKIGHGTQLHLEWGLKESLL